MWKKIEAIVKEMPISVRVKLKDEALTDWSSWLTFPSDGYGEIKSYGPFRIVDAEYIELNPIEIKKIGRLVPEKKVNHTEAVAAALLKAEIPYTMKESDVFRLYI